MSQGEGRMDASLSSGFHPCAASMLIFKTTNFTLACWKVAKVKSCLQAGNIPAEIINWRQRQMGHVQGSGQGNKKTKGHN